MQLFSFFEPESIPIFVGWQREDINPPRAQVPPKGVRYCLQCLCSCFNTTGNARNRESQEREFELRKSNPLNAIFELISKPSKFDQAVAELERLSLLRRLQEKGTLWIHDLTRLFITRSVSSNERSQWLQLAIEVLYRGFPRRDNSLQEHAAVDIYLMQASSIITQAKEEQIPTSNFAKLLAICATCHVNRGDYQTALEYYETALREFENSFGKEHRKTVGLVHRMAYLYRRTGPLNKAEEFERIAFRARERILGPTAVETLESLMDLAAVIERTGRLQEGQQLFENAHERCKTAFGETDSRTLACAHNLALCYANQGRLCEAKRLAQSTYEKSKLVFGKEDTSTLKTLGNLAVVVDHSGQTSEAILLYETALPLYDNAFGPNHMLTLRVRSNASGAYRTAGHYAKAEEVIQEVLRQFVRLYGQNHFDVCVALYDLGEVIHEKGALEDAQELYQQALQSLSEDYQEHPVSLRTVDAFGIVCRERGDLESCRKQATRAYKSNLSLLGFKDPYTLVAANNYAEMLHESGDLEGAHELYSKCLQDVKSLLGDDHPHALMIINNLGRLEWSNSNGDAIPHFQQAFEGYSKLGGDNNWCSLIASLNICRSKLISSIGSDVSEKIQEVLQSFTEKLGPKIPRVSLCEYYLGVTAANLGSWEEARSRFESAIDGFNFSLGVDHPNTLVARSILAACHRRIGDVDEAAAQMSVVETQGTRNGTDVSVRVHGETERRTLLTLDVERYGWGSRIALPWGETTRMRWGRKTCWREAEKQRLDD